MKVWKPKTAYSAKKDGTWEGIMAEIAALPDPEALEAWRYEFEVRGHRHLPHDWQEPIDDALVERAADFLHAELDTAFRETMR